MFETKYRLYTVLNVKILLNLLQTNIHNCAIGWDSTSYLLGCKELFGSWVG